MLNLYLEQRTLHAAIQSLLDKETVGGPATISLSHRVLQSAEEILVVGRGLHVADVVIDAFGASGRGNGPAKTAIAQVSLARTRFGLSLLMPLARSCLEVTHDATGSSTKTQQVR